MELEDVIGRVREADIRLSEKADRLLFDAPPGAIDQVIIDGIKKHRQELLRRLNADDVIASGPSTMLQARVAGRHLSSAFPAVWNCAARLDLTGELDENLLIAALRFVVERHWSLRSRLVRYGDRLVQEVLPARAVPIAVEDFREPATESDPEARSAAWCAELARRPFELDAGPPLRLALGRVSDDQWVLAFVQHHVFTDATSAATVLEEVAAFYNHGDPTAPPPLPPARQFLQFSGWQREFLKSSAAAQSIEYWRTVLACAPLRTALPTLAPESDACPGAGFQLDRHLTPEAYARLNALMRTRQLTLYPLLLTAFGRLLNHLTDQRDFLLTGSFANRGQPEFRSVAGLLANTVPIRLRTAGGETVGKALRRAQDTVAGALAHEALPYPYLIQQLGLAEAMSAASFPQAVCTLNRGPEDLRFRSLRTTLSEPDAPLARTQLGVFATVGPAGLRLRFEFAAGRFGRAAAEKCADQYVDLLGRIDSAHDLEADRW